MVVRIITIGYPDRINNAIRTLLHDGRLCYGHGVNTAAAQSTTMVIAPVKNRCRHSRYSTRTRMFDTMSVTKQMAVRAFQFMGAPCPRSDSGRCEPSCPLR